MPPQPLDFKISPELQQWNLQRWKFNHNPSSFCVLIISSNQEVVSLVSNILSAEGYGIEIATGGEAGWEAILKYKPHLIICDWSMPDISGVVLCQRVKANFTYPELKTAHFILLNNINEPTERLFGLDAGADELLAQPIDVYELRARARNGLRLALLSQCLIQAEQKLATRHELFEYLNLGDRQTGAFNQSTLDVLLSALLNKVKQSDRTTGSYLLSVLQINIDQLRKVFSVYGKSISDELLKAIAGRLQSNCKPNSLIYRYQDKNFLCVTPNLDLDSSLQLGKRLLSAIEQHPISLSGGLLLNITISIGGAIASSDNLVTQEELLEKTHQALNRVQNANNIFIMEPASN